MPTTWNPRLLVQLSWHWEHQLRPRLDGLTDEEYLWEPVAGCWSVRPRDSSVAPATATARVGGGAWLLDDYDPGRGEPQPPPVTTIAWRLAHLVGPVFGARLHSHFGGPGFDEDTMPVAGTAEEALAQLDEQYAAWVVGVRGLGESGLAEPCGPSEGPWAQSPMADLVLHIHREVIHHGAEIALLRDLYAHRG